MLRNPSEYADPSKDDKHLHTEGNLIISTDPSKTFDPARINVGIDTLMASFTPVEEISWLYLIDIIIQNWIHTSMKADIDRIFILSPHNREDELGYD